MGCWVIANVVIEAKEDPNYEPLFPLRSALLLLAL